MGGGEPAPADDKPFDDEPFDAGVEADEQSDPKKYIEQLTGKLGQSLRTYNESQGQPDLELEKFAINSLLSATHTADMDQEDQDDIIKKVKEAGNGDNQDDNQDDNGADNNDGNDDGGDMSSGNGSDFGGDMGGGEPEGDGGLNEEKEASIFLDKPKKNNMFQPGSNDILKENEYDFVKSAIESASGDKVEKREVDDHGKPLYWSLTNDTINYFIGDGEEIVKYNAAIGKNEVIGDLNHYKHTNKIKEGLNMSEKSSIFDKIKSKLHETFNQEEEMAEPMTEPAVKPAPVKTPKTTPIAPSRKNKPFLPMPEVQPDPKANQ